jgi:hypothetical protein
MKNLYPRKKRSRKKKSVKHTSYISMLERFLARRSGAENVCILTSLGSGMHDKIIVSFSYPMKTWTKLIKVETWSDMYHKLKELIP